MKKELDEKLCAKYPLIFRNRHGDMKETCMVWGFECGDGWYTIIDNLCGLIMRDYNETKSSYEHMLRRVTEEDKSTWDDFMKSLYTEENLAKRKDALEKAEDRVPIAAQVKEKYGGLRFYIDGASGTPDQRERVWALIDFAEAMSYRTCEVCGSPKDAMCYPISWHRTLCKEHAKENYGEENMTIFYGLYPDYGA
jgi:hypothetical protein